MKITAGSFPPLPPIYTPLLHHLVASMLQLEPEHRADTAMLTNSPIVVEHREKLLASHLSAPQMRDTVVELEARLCKSHALGYHFTDLDSARLVRRAARLLRVRLRLPAPPVLRPGHGRVGHGRAGRRHALLLEVGRRLPGERRPRRRMSRVRDGGGLLELLQSTQ